MRVAGCLLAVAVLLVGCATKGDLRGSTPSQASPAKQIQQADAAKSPPDKGLTRRIVTNEELLQVSRKDLSLTPPVCREILARLNARAPYHISEDIRDKRPLQVPNDFRAYKDWSPLPKVLPEFADVPKMMLIIKEQPFIGWYERGKLQADTYACLGKPGEDTEVGVYRVEDKDDDHVSRSYNNSYGQPAMMPWAMRIYDHVWIHAGDVTGPYCSHGCVILPVDPAQEVFMWGDPGTRVIVVESLSDLSRVSAQIARQ